LVLGQGKKIQNPDPNKKGGKPRYDQQGNEIPYDPNGESNTHSTGEIIDKGKQ